MYAADDAEDNESGNNKTYYYRGSTASNYVKFGGYYWRAIRVNGDGTVRLIYDGKNHMRMVNQTVIDKLERAYLINMQMIIHMLDICTQIQIIL